MLKFILWWVITIPVLIASPQRIIIFTVAANNVCFSKDTPIILLYLWVLVCNLFSLVSIDFLFVSVSMNLLILSTFRKPILMYSINKLLFYLKVQLLFVLRCYQRFERKQWFLRNIGTFNRYHVCYVSLLTQLVLSITRGYAIGELAYFIIHIRCVISSHIFHKENVLCKTFDSFRE